MPILDSAPAPKKVSDLIRSSLRLLGVIATGETPSADESADALEALNGMLESWNTERLIVYTIDHPTFALVPGQQTYSLGPGGDWDWTRPTRLEKALLQITSVVPNYEKELEIVNDDEWAAIAVKNLPNIYPSKLHNHNEYPICDIAVWPVPTMANNLVLYMWSQIRRFVSVTDEFAFPPGYERAIKYGLAIELAPEYGKSVQAEIAETYNNAKANIKRLNIEPVLMSCDSALRSEGGRFNWLTGEVL